MTKPTTWLKTKGHSLATLTGQDTRALDGSKSPAGMEKDLRRKALAYGLSIPGEP